MISLLLAGPLLLTATQNAVPWKPEDFISMESASSFEVSPDGTTMVWVHRKADETKNGARSKLMLTNLRSGSEITLTRGDDGASQPHFSPDGKLIGFVSDRTDPQAKLAEDSGPQIWAFETAGGEPYRLTAAKRGVQEFAWKKDGNIVFTSSEDTSAFENRIKDRKDTSIVVEDEAHEAPVRLFQFDTKAKTIRRLTTNETWIRSFKVSHDGQWAVTIEDQSLRVDWDHDRDPLVFLVNLTTGARRQIFSDTSIHVEDVVWSRDDKHLFATSLRSTAHPPYHEAGDIQLYRLTLQGNISNSPLNLQWDRGLTGSVYPTDEGFIATLADGARWRLVQYKEDNGNFTPEHVSTPTSMLCQPQTLAQDGQTMIYTVSSPSSLPQVYVGRLKGNTLAEPRQLTHLNAGLTSRKFAKSELIHWKGARGDEVEGILYYPLNYQSGKKYPLILTIHGGPYGENTDTWSDSGVYAHNLLAQDGAFTLSPNYHGSSGYGREFAESIANGHYYDYPVEDIEKSVDALIAKGLVDPDKVATLGWSNGAILSAALIADRPERFKASMLGAGGIEWTADWAVCGFGRSFDEYYLGGDPIHQPEVYRANGVLYKFDKVTAPTLIFVGTADTAVPPHHSWTEFRTLQAFTKTPVRFIEFPGEPHGPAKYVHQRRIVEETYAWFNRYFFNTSIVENEAIKTGSPLAELIRKKRIARNSNGSYGVLASSHLIPEIVSYSGLNVGRFEVTRAQYAAFDPAYKVPVGTENFPITGKGIEDARSYCKWLSSVTGKTYRLPNEGEAEKLYTSASGNTLDFWAGYDVNPADAARLSVELTTISPDDLLRPVGSFDSAGEDPIYDLGGNAAEWVDGKSGPATRGGSADSPKDAKGSGLKPSLRFTGFRVVRDDLRETSKSP